MLITLHILYLDLPFANLNGRTIISARKKSIGTLARLLSRNLYAASSPTCSAVFSSHLLNLHRYKDQNQIHNELKLRSLVTMMFQVRKNSFCSGHHYFLILKEQTKSGVLQHVREVDYKHLQFLVPYYVYSKGQECLVLYTDLFQIIFGLLLLNSILSLKISLLNFMPIPRYACIIIYHK